MYSLLTADALFLTSDRRSPSPAVSMVIQDAGGQPVARVHDRVGTLRWSARLLGILTRASAYDWEIIGADDRPLLQVRKPAERAGRGPSPQVAAGDGTLLGAARAGRGLASMPAVELVGPGEESVGDLEPALGQRVSRPVLVYRVRDVRGEVVGEIAHETGERWGYHLTFRPEADSVVRALTIGYALCLLKQRLTVAGT